MDNPCPTHKNTILESTSIGSNVNTDINAMTEDQQLVWDLLTNNAEHLCHAWAKDIMKSRRGIDRRADHYIGVMLREFSVDDTCRVLHTWLQWYKMPLDPNKLENFNNFHKQCGSYIVQSAPFKGFY